MKAFYILLAAMFFLPCGLAQAEDAQASDVINQVKGVVIANLEATHSEDIAATLATIHTQSPAYITTKQQLQILFDSYDLSYELKDYRFIGIDGEYAIARVEQVTRKISGAQFQDNEIDMIQIFRKEQGQWKYWSQTILNVNYL